MIGVAMQLIGKSKIGSLSARKGVRYPQLRLPQRFSEIMGDTADVFETESEGKQAFLVVTEQAMPNCNSVLKPNEEVLKQQPERGLDQRLSAIESKIAELKSILFNDNVQKTTQFTKDKKIKGRGRDSNPRRGLHRAIG
jgi:hypothetical protein